MYIERERVSVYIHIYTNPLKLKQGTRSTLGCIQIPSGQNNAQHQHRVAYKSPLAKTGHNANTGLHTNPLKLKQGTRPTQGCIQIPSS